MADHKSFRSLAEEVSLHSRLWLQGAKEGFCLHRCVIYWVHDTDLWWRSVRCFIFNGVIFGGSIVVFKALLAPGFRWLVSSTVPAWAPALDGGLYLAYTLAWLFPAYIVSFIVNCLWYQEIAERAYRVGQQRAVQSGQQARALKLAGRPMPFPQMLAQELFRMTLFCIFFLQSLAAGCIPVIGPVLNFVLLSWLYAFYFFDYKWTLTNVPLVTRVQHFEGHFAFFAGFGSVCTLATLIWPFFEGVAVMGVIFPLFVMVACEADPCLSQQRREAGGVPRKEHSPPGTAVRGPPSRTAQQRPAGAVTSSTASPAPTGPALRRLPLFQPAILATRALLARTHLLVAVLHWMGSHQGLLMVLAVLLGAAGLTPHALRVLGGGTFASES